MNGKATGKRRGGNYPHRLNVQLDTELKRSLSDASDRFGIAEGFLAREAIRSGLALVKDRFRKGGGLGRPKKAGTEVGTETAGNSL